MYILANHVKIWMHSFNTVTPYMSSPVTENGLGPNYDFFCFSEISLLAKTQPTNNNESKINLQFNELIFASMKFSLNKVL